MWFLLWPISHLRMWCLVSTYMWIFLVFFYLVLVSFSCVGEGTLCNLNLLKFVNIVSLTYGLSWRMFAPCALEKNVYSAVIGWNVLYMSVWYNWLIVLFLPVSLLTSVWLFYPYLKVGYWSFLLLLCCSLFLPLVCQCLLHIFGYSNVNLCICL